MLLEFHCPSCGKFFEKDASLAGNLGRDGVAIAALGRPERT